MISTMAAGVVVVGIALVAPLLAYAFLYLRSRAAAPPVDPAPLADLDDRLHAVEARLARIEGSPTRSDRPSAPASAAEIGRTRRVDRRRPSPTAGPVLIAVPNLAASPSVAVATEAAAEFDRRFGAIFALADAGTPLDEVARQTGYPAGQVELILGLRPPRPDAGIGGGPDPRRGDADA